MTHEQIIQGLSQLLGASSWRVVERYLDQKAKELADKILGEGQATQDAIDSFNNDKIYTKRDLQTLLRLEILNLKNYPQEIIDIEMSKKAIQDDIRKRI